MKPTPEIESAAKELLVAIHAQRYPAQAAIDREQVVAHFLAARDAERDARWEALKVAAQFLVNLWDGGWTNFSMRDAVRELSAALANLGAEEKPKCACPNPSLHTELAEGREIDPSKCANPKPEPKCGECGGSELVDGDWGREDAKPCPSCSKGPR